VAKSASAVPPATGHVLKGEGEVPKGRGGRGRGNSRGNDPTSRAPRGGQNPQRGGKGSSASSGERPRKGKVTVPSNYFSLLSADGEVKDSKIETLIEQPPIGEPQRRRKQEESSSAPAPTAPYTVTNKPTLSEDEQKRLDTAADMLLEEYLLNYDEHEAGECLKDLNAPHSHYKVVAKAVVKAIEKKEEERQLIAKLLFQLHSEQNLLASEAVEEGFRDVLQAIEDLDIDCPRASANLGSLIGQAVLDEILPLSFLNNGLDHLIASGKALKVAAEAFRVLANKTNSEEMMLLWRDSGLDFMKFLPPENRNLDYLRKYLWEDVSRP